MNTIVIPEVLMIGHIPFKVRLDNAYTKILGYLNHGKMYKCEIIYCDEELNGRPFSPVYTEFIFLRTVLGVMVDSTYYQEDIFDTTQRSLFTKMYQEFLHTAVRNEAGYISSFQSFGIDVPVRYDMQEYCREKEIQGNCDVRLHRLVVNHLDSDGSVVPYQKVMQLLHHELLHWFATNAEFEKFNKDENMINTLALLYAQVTDQLIGAPAAS
jgi:hypothetical protein